jgi:hypothetical protein
MAFSGTWKKVSSENGEAFFTAFEVPVEQLKRAAAATLVTVIADSGATMVVKRTYTEADG